MTLANNAAAQGLTGAETFTFEADNSLMGAVLDADADAGTARVEAAPRDRLGRALRIGDRAAGGVCVLALILMAALLVGDRVRIPPAGRPLRQHATGDPRR